MATATTPLIERQALAELNTLRDGPGWIRLGSHLLMIGLGGALWSLEALLLALRPDGLGSSGLGRPTCLRALQACGQRTVFCRRHPHDAVTWWQGLARFPPPDL